MRTGHCVQYAAYGLIALLIWGLAQPSGAAEPSGTGQAGAPPVIDYWSLDVEGSELRLLKSFPFDAYTFDTLTVEHNNLPVRRAIRSFMESVGFEYLTTLAIDDCYAREDWLAGRHSLSPVWRWARRRPPQAAAA